MENILKGIHLLGDIGQDQVHKLEQVALSYWQKARVTFKVFWNKAREVKFGVTQYKTQDEKYYSRKELIDIAHEAFDQCFPGKRVLVDASPYQESPALKVDPAWIKKKMEGHGVKLKDISVETGMDNTRLSALINGTRPLSDAMKAMFYFYFLSKEK